MYKIKLFIIKFVDVALFIYEQASSMCWLIFLYPIYFSALKKMGYKNVSLYKYKDWHLSCRYLVVHRNGSKCFVKCGRYFLIRNEITANDRITRVESEIVIKLHDYILSKFYPLNFCVFDYLEDYIPLNKVKGLMSSDINDLSLGVMKIVDVCESLSITHRDLSPSNLFVKEQDYKKVVVIDFAMAEGDGMLPLNFRLLNKLVVHSLGDGFRPSKYEWDDRYSARFIINSLKGSAIK